MSANNAAIPFATRSAAALADEPNLPKTLMMLRAESAPAPATSVSCHATRLRTMDVACRELLANEIASNNTAAVAEAPAMRVVLNCACAIGCLIAPVPGAVQARGLRFAFCGIS
eukprot:2497128-Alexandrium_andersonii.AAC.1